VSVPWPVEGDELLDRYAARVLDSGVATAVAVAVTDRRRTLVARTYGDALPDALWPIASIGKSLAAVVALQLVEEGVLDLHAPVTQYVPWLTVRSRFAPITLHHLLTHTAGVIESSDRAPASDYDVIALAETEAGFAPGEHRSYSNIGYRAVGVVLQTVTGRPLAELIQQRVLDRLGMRASVPVMLHETRRRLPHGHVPLYDDRPWQRDHGLVPAPWVESAEADGCQCCSLEDLAIYLRALWNGTSLFSPASLTAMKTAQPPHDEWPYGYGLEVEADGFGHGGDMLGYVSHMWAETAAGVGVVAFANGFRGASWLGEGALAIATRRPPPDLEREPSAPLADDGTCPPRWTPYLGRYRSHNPWLPTFLVAASRHALVMGMDWLAGSQRLPLTPVSDDTFRIGEPDWSPERLSFDTVVGRRAQRAAYNGTQYYRAFTT
jgi:CubicO group peptidase (beta-lactamase class C family)